MFFCYILTQIRSKWKERKGVSAALASTFGKDFPSKAKVKEPLLRFPAPHFCVCMCSERMKVLLAVAAVLAVANCASLSLEDLEFHAWRLKFGEECVTFHQGVLLGFSSLNLEWCWLLKKLCVSVLFSFWRTNSDFFQGGLTALQRRRLSEGRPGWTTVNWCWCTTSWQIRASSRIASAWLTLLTWYAWIKLIYLWITLK